MKFSGWIQLSDTKAQNQKEGKSNNSFKFVTVLLSLCVHNRIWVFDSYCRAFVSFLSLRLAWLLGHLLWACAKA